MPSTVTAGRAQIRSATLPVPISPTPSSTLASSRNASSVVRQPVPRRAVRQPVDRRRPSSARSESSIRISAPSASGAAPPN